MMGFELYLKHLLTQLLHESIHAPRSLPLHHHWIRKTSRSHLEHIPSLSSSDSIHRLGTNNLGCLQRLGFQCSWEN